MRFTPQLECPWAEGVGGDAYPPLIYVGECQGEVGSLLFWDPRSSLDPVKSLDGGLPIRCSAAAIISRDDD